MSKFMGVKKKMHSVQQCWLGVSEVTLFMFLSQQKLLDAHEEQNSEAFTEAVKEFDSVSRLDQWLTTMLLRIKKTIQGDAGDLK